MTILRRHRSCTSTTGIQTRRTEERAEPKSGKRGGVSAPSGYHRRTTASRNHPWTAELRDRFRSVRELADWLGVDASARWVHPDPTGGEWPMLVTRYYASLIRRWSPRDPIVRMCVPLRVEKEGRQLPPDPFGELGRTPAPCLLRRYRDRAALWVTTHCAVHCRHCTRRNELPCAPRELLPAGLARAVQWLRRHPTVREVLITGGDPFTLDDDRVDRILHTLRAVPSVGVIRVATRTPVVLPSRITRSLCRILRSHAPVWVVTHFNHPVELTSESLAACERLVDFGVPVVNQTVLLRGVNDSVRTLRRLFEGLLRARVRPYYLFCADPVRGTAHFRVPLDRTLRLVARLRRELSGLAMPLLAADVPGAPAKVPLPLVRVRPAGPDRVEFRDWLGDVWSYELRWNDRPAVVEASSHHRR